VLPGQADDSIALPLGYGRRADAERVACRVGVDAYALRTSAAPYVLAGATAARIAGRHALATTQSHWTLEGRPIVRSLTVDELRRAAHAPGPRSRTLSLYDPWPQDRGDQWAMAIDLSRCLGCGACMVACQAENNVPVVGKEGVLDSREMHWLRVDRYFGGASDEPELVAQPMLCQHCERAPCEYVCPVNATVHSHDGLNEMIYPRCVGTRFCSNNCPYKVRRFNWFEYTVAHDDPRTLAANPDVTVRARGVVEKCTFCVQRIRGHQLARGLGQEPAESGTPELQTACQQACPTRAIVFGSLTEPRSEVARLHADPRAYRVLEELGTEPRVRYLARVRNPNPALAAPADDDAAG
jgi:molybdopterin-containing oxidoreductase family iron-sulfur binding subunit